jgi:hypothetical protein
MGAYFLELSEQGLIDQEWEEYVQSTTDQQKQEEEEMAWAEREYERKKEEGVDEKPF